MPAINHYARGNTIRSTGTFTDPVTGAVTDPAVIHFSFKNPVGATTTYVYGTDTELVKDSTGVYHVDVDANMVGSWYERWYGELSVGVLKAARETHFVIDASEF